MTPYQKGWIVVLIRVVLFIGLLVALISGVPLALDFWVFVVLFVFALGAIFIAPEFAKCPKCGVHVAGRFANTTSVFDFDFDGILPSEICSGCGKDLTK